MALARVGFLVQNVGVVLESLADGQRLLDDRLRQATGRVLTDLADVIEAPGEEHVAAVRGSVEELLSGIADSRYETNEERYLAGVLAASVRLAVSSVTTHLVPAAAD